MYFALKGKIMHACIHHHIALFAFDISKVGNYFHLKTYLRKYIKRAGDALYIVFDYYGFICNV